jgi:hypothetical protein
MVTANPRTPSRAGKCPGLVSTDETFIVDSSTTPEFDADAPIR